MNMRTTSPAKWIEKALAEDSFRAKSLVMTIFGDSIVPRGGTIWLGCLIELLALFGVNERHVRTSVFRLTEEGWLESARSGRRSSYAITPDAMKRFNNAYRRIYASLEPVWDGHWLLLLAPNTGIAPYKRTSLRKELLWEGFGLLSTGVYASPVVDEGLVQETLHRFRLEKQLFVFKAMDLPRIGGKSLADAVNEAWPLKEVNDGYARFIDQFTPLSNSLSDTDVTPEQAFIIRTLLIHEFRRVQLHDPKLPTELLSSEWPGKEAYTICSEIYRKTYALADEHLSAVLSREEKTVTEIAPYYFQRFGGLR